MIKIATIEDIEKLINRYPGIANFICKGDEDFTLMYIDNGEIIAVLSAFVREIPAPLNGKTECFINVIDVLDTKYHGKGIGSMLVQESINTAKSKSAMQVRAYCEINNISSHALWLKNDFGISPVKDAGGSIVGSFVTYRLKEEANV